MSSQNNDDILASLKAVKKTKTNALGKGISALLSDAHENVPSESEVKQIKLDFCEPSRFQARKKFDEEELKNMASSIKQKGVIQPVLLREISPSQYEIIAGERRCRAAKIAGLTEIPAIVKTFSDQEAMEIGLIENIQRRDLSPIEEANAYKFLIDDFNYTHEEIAASVGKSRSYISNYLRILGLPPEIIDFIKEGKISAGHAKMLVSSQNPIKLAYEIVNLGLSVRDVEDAVKKEKDPKAASKAKKGFLMKHSDSDIESWYSETKRQYKSLDISVLSKRKESGELKIKYNNLNDLKRILGIY